MANRGISSIDKISDTLMARLETQQARGTKRPTSPPEGDIPNKRSEVPSGRTTFLPESFTPVFNVSMFGDPVVRSTEASHCENSLHSNTGMTNSESHSVEGSSRSAQSPLQLALGNLVSPLNVNVTQPLSAPSGPSTLTHDDSPSDSETDDHGTVEESIFTSNDSLSPFLQSILSGSREARDEDVFCSVPGRLSLLSQASKYQVTVGEIRRRLSAPESLNASLLGGILRRAKSKNGGKILREAIQAVGMELPVGRRKSIKISLLTSLVEGEAQQLARDFSSLSNTEFPIREMAAVSEVNRKSKGMSVEKRLEQISAAKELIGEFIQLSQPTTKNGESVAEFKLNEGLEHFELATHRFGMDAVQTGISTFHRFLESQRQLMEHSDALPSSSSPSPSFSSTSQASPSLSSSRNSAFSQVKSTTSQSSPRPFAVPKAPTVSSLSSPSLKTDQPSVASFTSANSSSTEATAQLSATRGMKIETPEASPNPTLQASLQALFANPHLLLSMLQQHQQSLSQ